jgi:hypothetical protein
MFDRGLMITLLAIRRQLAAMPNELYLIRLIHHTTRRSFPGERLWTATQLGHAATVRFLRIRNREGCDIYLQPYTQHGNAGYILVDLDRINPAVIESMRAHGHDPCVVLQTSPGHLQAWIPLSTSPLEPSVATAAGKLLARLYGGDLASADWRHLGRLAGFTNQKPERRTPGGFAPWVKIVDTHPGLARNAVGLLQSTIQLPALTQRTCPDQPSPCAGRLQNIPPSIAVAEATQIYQGWMQRWRIAERFPQPDWSIVDFWIARQLLSQGTPAEQVRAILQLASPHFPRRHADPDNYLRRTVARAAFPAPRRTVWTTHATASDLLACDRDCSNSTGGR